MRSNGVLLLPQSGLRRLWQEPSIGAYLSWLWAGQVIDSGQEFFKSVLVTEMELKFSRASSAFQFNLKVKENCERNYIWNYPIIVLRYFCANFFEADKILKALEEASLELGLLLTIRACKWAEEPEFTLIPLADRSFSRANMESTSAKPFFTASRTSSKSALPSCYLSKIR